MKKNHISRLILTLCLPLLALPINVSAAPPIGLHMNLPASTSQPVQVTLPWVVDRVLNNNLTILSAKNRVHITQGSLIQSTAPLFPSVRSFYSVERFNGGEVISGGQPVNLDRTTYRPTIAGDYTIQTGGKPFFQIWAAKQQHNRSKLAISMNQQKALLDACTTYFTWLKDIEREHVAQVSLDEAESQMHLRELRLKADLGTNLEVMQSQTVERERQNLLLSTHNDRASSALALLNHLNLPLDLSTQAEPDMNLIPMRFWLRDQPNQDLNELYKMAETSRPDLKALITQITEAKAQLGAAWADLLPSITISGYARKIGQYPDALRRTSQGMFVINTNLLQNMGINSIGSIHAARAKVQDALLNKAKQLQDIQKAISDALLDYKLYKDQMGLEQQRCLETEEAYRIAKARFDAGVALNLEVVQAEAAMTAARLKLQTAVMNYNITQLRLLYETGQLDQEAILTAQAISLSSVTTATPINGYSTKPTAEALPSTTQNAKQTKQSAAEDPLAPVSLYP
jgi:outer membrane protein TolC